MSLSDNKKFIMLFTDLLRRIREEKQIPQKRLAAALDIDTCLLYTSDAADE